VDGFRIDVANALVKDPALPDLGVRDAGRPQSEPPDAAAETVGHPFWDRDEVHDIYRRWHRIAESYRDTVEGPRMFVAEAWRVRPDGLARYVRPDELQGAFNFEYLNAPWEPEALRSAIDHHIAMLDAVGASPSWVLSNHDTVRVVTRYGTVIGPNPDGGGEGIHLDLDLGLRRARAAALLMLALPGAAYIYQGDELGLPEVDDLPDEARQDPIWRRSGSAVRGRDGCRVPLPWSDEGPSLGFGSAGSWLPQPADWANLSVTRQSTDPDSVLSLYRRAIALRRAHLKPGVPSLRWRDASDGVLALDRGDAFGCVVNFTGADVSLEASADVLLASRALEGGRLPSDTAVWLRRNP